MMYLVLTALLALNVSREIIEAFVLVEGGLNKSIENFNEKNKSIYDSFSQAELENPDKVKPWRLKADAVRNRTKSISNYIQDLKIEIIQKADGEDAVAVKGREIYSDSILKSDNLDYGGEVLIGAEHNGKGYDLKDSLIALREFLSGSAIDPPQSLKESFRKILNTDDPPNIGTSEKKTWETMRFDNLPLIAVITMLSKIQTDITNVESDAINHLFKQIGILDVKVNKIDAVVRSKSSYIFKDGTYEAEVFLAAFDTTQTPTIYVGRVDSTVNDAGIVEYFMAGELGKDYDTLHVEDGVGKYSAVGHSLSPSVKWGGLIELKTPSGLINYPFEADYQVGDVGLVVSPTKMNVFYIGVDNPVDISVPGVPKENIVATMTNGTIREDKATGGWMVRPTAGDLTGKRTSISVNAEIHGKKREMGSVAFRVKTVPDPVAKVAMSKGGVLQRSMLLAQTGVFCEIENFDFEMPFKVTSFDVTAIIQGFEDVKSSNSNKFTEGQYDLIKKLRRGDKVNFENIKAKGDDGITRPLPPMIFKLQ
ncbi:MAG: gliding motility protein GldM [Bacteroidales bacterium]|nr:gliding motility protein GldM [Bacteroidales bacterium]MCF8455963.1 gliding motility protein GldM [Bacteroidales bacterium]